MPQVYEVTARFRRQTQPVQYQAAESELVVKAQFNETEYSNGDAAKLLAEVQATVLSSLGLSSEAPAPVSQAAGTAAPKEEPKPKKAAAKKVETAPAAGSVQTGSAAAALDMGDGSSNSTTPAAGSSSPAPAASTPAGVSDEDLQKTASAASQRLGGAGKVKELMKKFGVARLGELPQEKRADFIKECDALKKD